MKHRIVLTLLLLSFVPASLAATLSVEASFQTVMLGSQATVNVRYTGGYVGDYDLNIDWNPAILSFSSLTFGSQLGGPANSIRDSTSGTGTLNAYEVSLLVDLVNGSADLLALQPGQTATLFTLVFNTLMTGTSAVDLSVVALGDENGLPQVPPGLILNDGSIRVIDDNGGVVPEPGTFFLLAPFAVWVMLRKLTGQSS